MARSATHANRVAATERILREIETFVGAAAQRDDMTMILLKVDELASAAGLSGVTVDRGIRLASARSGA